jgi:hypothetical protein
MKTEKKRRGRPRKSSEETKSESLLLRLAAREKRAFGDAARIAGIPLTVWIRERLRRAAVRELEEAAHPIAFLD